MLDFSIVQVLFLHHIIIIIIITEFPMHLLHQEHRCISVIKVCELSTSSWKMPC